MMTDEEIVVATTRVETVLGDVAVAVHPEDTRYTKHHNRRLVHPFSGQLLPLILDESVKMDFGTGAVKVTPGHDPIDFELGRRHGLEIKSVIDDAGCIVNSNVFCGLNRFLARNQVLAALQSLNLVRKIEAHSVDIPFCSRSGDIIEYLVKPQWFLKCSEMARVASESVRRGELCIEPTKYEADWFTWLDNIKDWCISRQLWWGHQLPFYLCKNSTEEKWVAAESEEKAREVSERSMGKSVDVQRCTDVVDTWFSSALLPFTAFGWPQTNNELERYPLSVMVTGRDIIFFWVARMTMLGHHLTGQLPFKKILLHSIICDPQGRKMSKSLGNVIDPLHIINGCSQDNLRNQIMETYEKGLITKFESARAVKEIEKSFPKGIPPCGADALRFTLLSHNIKSKHFHFDFSVILATDRNACDPFETPEVTDLALISGWDFLWEM